MNLLSHRPIFIETPKIESKDEREDSLRDIWVRTCHLVEFGCVVVMN